MNTTILLIAAGTAALTMAALLTGRRADVRGIALQTVIVMVVLLAIAGTVAGVLLSKSGEVTNQLEATNIGTEAANYQHQGLCQRAGHGWATASAGVVVAGSTTALTLGKCYSLSEVGMAAATGATKAQCQALNPNWDTMGAGTANEKACKPA